MTKTQTNRFVIELSSEGNCELTDLTRALEPHVKGLKGAGVLHLFVVGSTAALTTIEFEPGLVRHDLKDAFQRLVPDNIPYHHEATWHDDNGHAHIRAAMVGPSLTVPFDGGRLMTGEYQQVVLVDFDTRPRRRKIIGTVLGV